MLWVLGFCKKDADLALENLRTGAWLHERRINSDRQHRILFSVPRGVEYGEHKEVAETFYQSAEIFQYDDYLGQESWPVPQNWAWQETARHIQTLDVPSWFWLEPDVTPLTPDWREKLEDLYAKEGKPFMGYIVDNMGGHMNGVAAYPGRVAPYSTDPFLTSSTPFDIALSKSLGDNFIGKANSLIHHVPRPNGIGLSVKSKRVVNGIVKSGAVLFHGCTDASLPLVVRGKRPKTKDKRVSWVYTEDDIHVVKDHAHTFHFYDQHRLHGAGWRFQDIKETQKEVAPLVEQTPYPCGYFNLHLTRLLCHFNPTIIKGPSGNVDLIVRQWIRPDERAGNWQSNLNRHPVDVATMKLENGTTLFSGLSRGEQREDPRATVWNKHTLVSYVQWFKAPRRYIAHQAVAFFDASWVCKHTLHLPYGGNSSIVDQGTGHEKNWLWFDCDGKLKMVYQWSPHTVVDVDVRTSSVETVHKTDSPVNRWKYGEIRGGTNPVRVGDLYYSFFHSSLWWKNKQKRYYMGAYAFEAKEPHNIVGITENPILIGSEHDSRTLGGPLCVFPCGSLYLDGMWIVTLGVNDEKCAWIKIPHKELVNVCR